MCKVCTFAITFNSHISQLLLMSGVLTQLSLGKHMAQKKGFEILEETIKAGAPLSKYFKLEKSSIYDPTKG